MNTVAHGLMLKYGLNHGPTPEEVQRWREAVEQLVSQGVPLDEAGRQAAKQVFADCGTMFYKSEADTIEMLLSKAKEK